MIADVLRNINLFVDGHGYAGRVMELTLPKLNIKVEEYRAGGMDAAVEIDQGMEKMECDFSLDSVDIEVLKRWGLAPGNAVPMTFRGAVESQDGTVKSVIARIRGQIKSIDFGAWKAGEKSTLKAMAAVYRYTLEIDGETIHDIDPENMIRTVNGTDQIEARRAALGI